MVFVKGQVPMNKKVSIETKKEEEMDEKMWVTEKKIEKKEYINGKWMAHWANVTNWFKPTMVPQNALSKLNALLK